MMMMPNATTTTPTSPCTTSTGIFDYSNYHHLYFAGSTAASAAQLDHSDASTFIDHCGASWSDSQPAPTITTNYAWMKRDRPSSDQHHHHRVPKRCTSASEVMINTENNNNDTDDGQQQKARIAYSNQQVVELEKEFRTSRYLNRTRRADLALLLRLTDRQVKIWFQNRRMKEKKRVKDQRPPVDAISIDMHHPTVSTNWRPVTSVTDSSSSLVHLQHCVDSNFPGTFYQQSPF